MPGYGIFVHIYLTAKSGRKKVASINWKIAATRPNPPQIKNPIPAKFLKTKNTRVRVNFHSIKWPYFGVVPSLAADWVSVV